MTDIQKLKERAMRNKTSITHLCKLAGIRRDTITRWEKKPPLYVTTLKQLNEILDKIEKGY